MLAKLTSKNRLTLPKSVVTSVGNAEYYDVVVDPGRIILTPVGSPYKSMQVDFYQRLTGIGITNKNRQVNAA